jgi:molybdenum cofactor cytidylyltransferase
MNCDIPPSPRIVVLAAGFSARLGRPKALTRVRGSSLVRRTLRAIAPFATAPIIVVTPARAARMRAELRGYRVVLAANLRRGEGLSSSVRCGLRHARYARAVLLLPTDLSHLDGRDIGRLIARWRGARRRVAARRIGATPVVPLILPRRFYPLALAISGDAGLKTLLRDLPPGQVALLSLPSAAFDVDTPHDLERARRRTRPRDL